MRLSERTARRTIRFLDRPVAAELSDDFRGLRHTLRAALAEANIRSCAVDVRVWPKADIRSDTLDVRL